jgi:hypothetical protein
MSIQLRHIQVEASDKNIYKEIEYLFLHYNPAAHLLLFVLLQVGLLGGTHWIDLQYTPPPPPARTFLVELLAKKILQRRGRGRHMRPGLLWGTWWPLTCWWIHHVHQLFGSSSEVLQLLLPPLLLAQRLDLPKAVGELFFSVGNYLLQPSNPNGSD